MMSTLYYFFCCMMQTAQAQEDWTQLFADIEENNLELQSLQRKHQSQRLSVAQHNQLDNIQIDGFYLLPHYTAAPYVEFQFTQGFDFPLLYGARSTLHKQLELRWEQEYKQSRQEILWEAEQHLLMLVHLQKKVLLEEARAERAKLNLAHYEDLWKSGELDTISWNKVRLVWLKEQFVLPELEVEKEHLVVLIQELQGGKPLRFIPKEYPSDVNLPALADIWNEKKKEDVHLQRLAHNIAIAEQQIKIGQWQQFPNIRLGYNVQGNIGMLSSGVYLGLDIPLWQQQQPKKIAEIQHQYEQLQQQELLLHEELFLDVHYGDHQLLVDKYQQYKTLLAELSGEELLEQGFLNGAFSFVEYYQERNFYREAQDAILDMEWQLHQSKSHILQYKH